MTTFNLPNSIAITNGTGSWSSIEPFSTHLDTATKKHYAAQGSSGGVDIFFELNGSVITADVNSAPIPVGDAPNGISITGVAADAADSVTVTAGDTVYLHQWTPLRSFVWQSSWTTSSGDGTNTEEVTPTEPSVASVKKVHCNFW